jgi:hypothetical protein
VAYRGKEHMPLDDRSERIRCSACIVESPLDRPGCDLDDKRPPAATEPCHRHHPERRAVALRATAQSASERVPCHTGPRLGQTLVALFAQTPDRRVDHRREEDECPNVSVHRRAGIHCQEPRIPDRQRVHIALRRNDLGVCLERSAGHELRDVIEHLGAGEQIGDDVLRKLAEAGERPRLGVEGACARPGGRSAHDRHRARLDDCLGGGKPVLERVLRGFRPIPDAELAVNVVQVELDGLVGEPELLRDRPV